MNIYIWMYGSCPFQVTLRGIGLSPDPVYPAMECTVTPGFGRHQACISSGYCLTEYSTYLLGPMARVHESDTVNLSSQPVVGMD